MTAPVWDEGSESVIRSEHISPLKSGDNIEAKRVANYVWNGTQWERVGNSNGFNSNSNITTDISTPGTIIESDGVKTLTTVITSTEITETWS